MLSCGTRGNKVCGHVCLQYIRAVQLAAHRPDLAHNCLTVGPWSSVKLLRKFTKTYYKSIFLIIEY